MSLRWLSHVSKKLVAVMWAVDRYICSTQLPSRGTNGNPSTVTTTAILQCEHSSVALIPTVSSVLPVPIDVSVSLLNRMHSKANIHGYPVVGWYGLILAALRAVLRLHHHTVSTLVSGMSTEHVELSGMKWKYPARLVRLGAGISVIHDHYVPTTPDNNNQ